MLFIPPIAPPPPTAILTATPGTSTELSHTHISSPGTCAVLAHSTDSVGTLSAPIHIRLHDCKLSSSGKSIFFVTNAHAEIKLTDCRAGTPDSLLLRASEATWGKPGFNAATVQLRADNCQLTGDIYAGPHCKVEFSLGPSTIWQGQFTGPGTHIIHRHPSSVWAKSVPQNTKITKKQQNSSF